MIQTFAATDFVDYTSNKMLLASVFLQYHCNTSLTKGEVQGYL